MVTETKSEIVSQMKKLIQDEKIILGSSVTIKELKKGNVKKVFLSSNIKDVVKNDINHYASLIETEVVDTGLSNEELGIICKKSFLISVIGEKK